MSYRALAVLALLVVLAGCSSLKETDTGRTATEQMLLSTAADRAAEQVATKIPTGTTVFIDERFVEGADAKYAIAAIRDHVLRRGASLVAERKDAAMAVELRIGALSIDDKNTLVGIPDFGVPIPLAGNVNVPEIALFKKRRRQGVIKLAATTMDAKTGELVQAGDPVYGFAQKTDWGLLFFFSWTRNDLMPDQDNVWVGK
ncbi:MAG: hypothetical protein KBC46_10075 [Ferrovibrio sp.]|uniref:DUF6655 family protein n=1 Tax=Ferrovibrio sp. TaxID=1917215 RepID=UPI001B7B815B|nr:hypothetical protein [Ferrovibrio sp.]